jgi:hypothetical protein
LEAVIDTSLESIDDLLGHRSSLLLVYQPELDRLVTLASHGYDSGGVGSEVALGEGVIGMVAARQCAMRIGNLQRMLSYARTVQRATSDTIGEDIRLPGLPDAGSQMAAPLIAGVCCWVFWRSRVGRNWLTTDTTRTSSQSRHTWLPRRSNASSC